ncbi:MAG TPA: endonuclease/exonuclease/phosphatase family protein [Saprospiraceae bacterium]|nr:endonuclease/exonuclease/phosphatase family protein [Saprospiraceae bacterium]
MKFIGIIALVLMTVSLSAQEKLTVACLAFYNLENLFDTLDSPDTDDFEFTPNGPNVYNTKVYYDKLSKLARVISELGTDFTPDGAAIIGTSEIENINVLKDLVKQPALVKRGYQIIHQDSKDGRGVDVALLYQPKYFTPIDVGFYSLKTNKDDEPVKYSRDILVATGNFNGDTIIVTVNHWPSRRGGEQNTAWLRNKAAQWNHQILDSLFQQFHCTKSVVMGDLNDDPVNDSVKKYLGTGRSLDKLKANEMYNPFEDYYRQGLGTTAYQDAWSLFDQIILSNGLATDQNGFHFYKARVHNPAYLTQTSGNFKGYPLRTYDGSTYAGGYSDHFPVYVLLVKPQT